MVYACYQLSIANLESFQPCKYDKVSHTTLISLLKARHDFFPHRHLEEL